MTVLAASTGPATSVRVLLGATRVVSAHARSTPAAASWIQAAQVRSGCEAPSWPCLVRCTLLFDDVLFEESAAIMKSALPASIVALGPRVLRSSKRLFRG